MQGHEYAAAYGIKCSVHVRGLLAAGVHLQAVTLGAWQQWKQICQLCKQPVP